MPKYPTHNPSVLPPPALGSSLQFATGVLQTYLAEQSVDALVLTLQKTGIDDRLHDLFPPNKRGDEFLARHFESQGLKPVVDFYKRKQAFVIKVDAQRMLVELLGGRSAENREGGGSGDGGKENDSATTSATDLSGSVANDAASGLVGSTDTTTNPDSAESAAEKNEAHVVAWVKDQMKKNGWTESETLVFVWDALFEAVDWSNRPEQIEGQIIKTISVSVKRSCFRFF